MSGHIPPRLLLGSVPKMVVNPKRTCPSSCVMTDSMASFNVDHDVSALLGTNVLASR